jgi:Flp pilus assembly protein TadB
LSLQHKILAIFVGASILILLLTVYYIGSKAKRNAIENAYVQMGATADKHAEIVRALLEKDYYIVKTLSSTIQNHKQLTNNNKFEVYASIYKNVLSENSEYNCGLG